MTSDNSYDFAPPQPASPEAKALAPVSTEPIVAAPEMLCPSCGFKMVGKRRVRCPECGAPLDQSVADLLQNARPAYTEALSWGPLLMAMSPVLHGVGIALVWKTAPALGELLHLAAAGALAGGAWLVTAEEPPPKDGSTAAPQRRAALGLIGRWSAIAAGALWVLLVIVFFSHRTQSLHPLTALVLLVMAIESVCLGAFLAALAARVPHDGLATQFLNLAGLMPVVLGGLIAAQFIDVTPWLGNLFFCSFPLMGGLGGIGCWITVTLLRLALELRSAAAAAEAIAVRRAQKVKPKAAG